MTNDEIQAWVLIKRAEGEASAVGEIDLVNLLWPREADLAAMAEGGVRSDMMRGLRRAIRKIVATLRLDYNKPILDSPHGYYLAASKDEEIAFCKTRHRRGITSLVIESIVRRQSVAQIGVQQLFEFIAAEERRRRRVFERTGVSSPAPSAVEAVQAILARLSPADLALVADLVNGIARHPFEKGFSRALPETSEGMSQTPTTSGGPGHPFEKSLEGTGETSLQRGAPESVAGGVR